MAKDFAPWSAETAEGIKTDPVDSNIDVKQQVVPALSVGTINAKTGEWTGVLESDTAFLIDATHEAVANGADVLVPQSQPDYIDMTGFNDLFIAIKPSNGGNVAITAVMGPDTNTYANLTPVNAAGNIRGANLDIEPSDFDTLFADTGESLVLNVWNIRSIKSLMSNQKLLQFKITNNSGGPSNIQFAYLRVV
jgi:hypothetical protein